MGARKASTCRLILQVTKIVYRQTSKLVYLSWFYSMAGSRMLNAGLMLAMAGFS